MASLLTGTVAVAFTAHGKGPFSMNGPADRLLLAQTFVAVLGVTALVLAAVTSERRRAEEAEREIAETLQRSLLPDAAPSVAGWEIATLYRPAGAAEVEVGGNFYDFFGTPDGRIRELAGAGPLLGVASGRTWPERTVRVGPDETALLYTDGVTDTRGKAERFGERRLTRLLIEHADDAPDALLAELESALDRFQLGQQSDDTAAVALRLSGVEPLSETTDHPTGDSPDLQYSDRVALELAVDDQAPRQARTEVREAIAGRVTQTEPELAVLITSELVTNAVVHPLHQDGASIGLRIGADEGRVRVEVTDSGAGFNPGELTHDDDAPGGRGLIVVDRGATRWGTIRNDRFSVWFELSADRNP